MQRRPDVVAGICLAAALVVALQAFGATPLLRFGGPTTASSTSPSGWLAYMKPKAAPQSPSLQALSFEEDSAMNALPADTGPASVNATGIREVIGGMEVLTITTGAAVPNAVLLLFHGCSHSAIDWWHASKNCTTCLGLPEEVGVARAALRRGWAAVAFSSTDREQRCWDTHSQGRDVDYSRDVAAVIQAWSVLAERSGWAKLPRFALGASSGGAMVLALAQRLPLDGVCAMIMAVPPQALGGKPADAASVKTWAYPPAFFVHMARDTNTARAVAADMAVLKKQGVWTDELVVQPRPLSPMFFSDRSDAVDAAASEKIYKALRDAKLLNATGYLVDDPRQTGHEWRKAVQAGMPEAAQVSLRADEAAVPELLNLAWARHEIDSDAAAQALDWMEARRQDASAKMLTVVKPRRALRATAAAAH
ncbi:hypothetical protein WJX81_002164 [Elliptochloris bilobata]|uniref:Uncharacterized protein n=1 Tax=Elliptochloris bilobata TaxID=381761 RepID=A0AAW1RRM6_9CHLO